MSSKTTIRVTVVIPSHNNARLLRKTLACFAAQKTKYGWEIIVVDNNTNNDTIARLQREYRAKINITLVQQPHLAHPFSLCSARNIGVKLARGEWIVVMDADTIPNAEYMSNLEAFINAHGSNPVIATCERIFVSTDALSASDIEADPKLLSDAPVVGSPSNYGKNIDRRLPTLRSLPKVDHPWDYMHGCNVIFRKQEAVLIDGYDEEYDGHWGFEDIDFAYRMITLGLCKPLYAPGLYVYHQDLEGDETHKERLDKGTNPNWHRVCKSIPGYEDYKTAKYKSISTEIMV